MLIMNAATQAGCEPVWLALAGRRTATRAYKSASLKDRKPFALIVLDAPSHDGTPADIRIHFIFNKKMHRSTFCHY